MLYTLNNYLLIYVFAYLFKFNNCFEATVYFESIIVENYYDVFVFLFPSYNAVKTLEFFVISDYYNLFY
jgi:hypothetical protein